MKKLMPRILVILIVLSFFLGLSNTPITAGPAERDEVESVGQTIQGAWELEYIGGINGPITAVAVQGSYAYVGDINGLMVMDISNPASPTPVSRTLSSIHYVPDVTVAGNLAYVTAGTDGLRVVEISDPANPLEIGFHDTLGQAEDTVISGNYAYVADLGSGLRVVDVSNPSSPVEVGAFSGWTNTYGVAVSGNYAFLADAAFGLIAVDVSNPVDPFEVDSLSMISQTMDVAVSGNYAYTANDSAGLRVVDISDPANMVEVGFYDTPGYAFEVTISGSYAYVADSEGGLRVIDISNAANPVEIGFYDAPEWALQVDVSGDYAYVADELAGLWVVNVSNPAAPVPAGAYLIPSSAADVTVSGNFAYVLDASIGLLAMNISDPANPVGVGIYRPPGIANDMAISENYAYVAATDSGLRVVDVSNPANPVEAGFYDTPSSAFEVVVSGNYAYVADNGDSDDGGLRVLDISNPANPVEVGSLLFAFAYGLEVSGDYAYVRVGCFHFCNESIHVIDVSNPAAPVQVGYYYPVNATDIVVSGDYAYVTGSVFTPDRHEGLLVLDITDPANPTEAGFYETPAFPNDLVVSGNYTYVTVHSYDFYSNSLRVIDISNPSSPVEVGSYETLDDPQGVAVSEDYVYVADGYGGLLTLRFSEPLEYIGFQPTWNGYSFANYGAKNYGDYTFPDMQRMFGEEAVCWTGGIGCEARSQASLWNTLNYQLMNQGHSYGMAVSGLRFFKDVDAHPAVPSVYAMHKTSDVLFSWDGEIITTTLRRDIGFFTVSQLVEPLRSAIRQSLEQTPAEIFAQVEASMADDAPDPLVLLVVAQGKGHALIPYAISSHSEGIYEVWVYDNEHPADPERAMIFDLAADTWSYDTGNGMWSGDASSHSLGVIPMSTHSQVMQCPWCASRLQSAATSHLLTMQGNGHLLVTDSQGRQLGYLGSEYVEEIPGGYGAVPLLGTGSAHEPLYTLPLTETYTLLLDGQTVSQTTPASLWQFGPGYAASLQGLNVGPSTQDIITIGSDGTLLGYHASQAQEPTLMLALDVLSATYGLDVQWIDIGASEVVTLTVDTTQGDLVLDGSHASGGFYNLLIRKMSDAGGLPFYHSDIAIQATDTHIIHFSAWDGHGAITLEIDHGSDGTIDETLTLVNQVVWAFLPDIYK
jgi:hypothetical protein